MFKIPRLHLEHKFVSREKKEAAKTLATVTVVINITSSCAYDNTIIGERYFPNVMSLFVPYGMVRFDNVPLNCQGFYTM